MEHRAAPASSAIAGALDLYGDGQVVLAATTEGISRSVDGGRRWRSVLSGYPMSSVSRGPTGYYAIGTTRHFSRDVVATSRNGVAWTTVEAQPRGGERLPAYAFGSAAAMDGPVAVEAMKVNRVSGAVGMQRTGDGGRHWRPVRAMRDAEGGLQLEPDGSMVATAEGSGGECSGAVWRSDDLGATWQELPASCSRFALTAVQFTSPSDGVAVGGVEAKVGGGQVIETTIDGGLHWTVTRHVPNCQSSRCRNRTVDGLADVDFVTPESGFVLEGVCPDSLPGPCGGELLWTNDGGRTLTRLASPSGDGWLSVAVTGPRRYVGAAFAPDGEKGFSAIGLTNDAGRRWAYRAPPDSFHTDYGDPLRGAGRQLLWITPVGTLISHDAGRHWTLVQNRHAAQQRLRAYRRDLAGHGRPRWQLRSPGLAAHTWVLYQPRPGTPWQVHQMPNWAGDVESIFGVGPHTAVFAGLNGNLWRSHDGGATWQETWPTLPGEDR